MTARVDELLYNTSFVLYRHLEETRGIALRIVKHRDRYWHPITARICCPAATSCSA